MNQLARPVIVGASEAKSHLSALLDRVERGEEVVITRHGHPVAWLVPERRRIDRDGARNALNDLNRRREQLAAAGVRFQEGELHAMLEKERR